MIKKRECESGNFSEPANVQSDLPAIRGTLSRLPSAGEIEQFMQFSRETLAQIPSDEDIRCLKLDMPNGELVRSAMLLGKWAIRSMSGEHGNVDADDAYSALVLLHQQNLILTSAADDVARSCIGTCRAEQQGCKEGGTSKHRCNWDGFLCRLNCFFKIEIRAGL